MLRALQEGWIAGAGLDAHGIEPLPEDSPFWSLPNVIITPHNEAIRYEFALGFSRWHQQQYGRPVKVDWRAIGGASEISRYLTAEFISAARGWCI